mmetsp:Transcript_61273/g.168108  ORF Transcript_61273/g.168108 Transcript_61273/m.168108 type:complete len:299 (+) Transcript_61273:144-1040(+)
MKFPRSEARPCSTYSGSEGAACARGASRASRMRRREVREVNGDVGERMCQQQTRRATRPPIHPQGPHLWARAPPLGGPGRWLAHAYVVGAARRVARNVRRVDIRSETAVARSVAHSHRRVRGVQMEIVDVRCDVKALRQAPVGLSGVLVLVGTARDRLRLRLRSRVRPRSSSRRRSRAPLPSVARLLDTAPDHIAKHGADVRHLAGPEERREAPRVRREQVGDVGRGWDAQNVRAARRARRAGAQVAVGVEARAEVDAPVPHRAVVRRVRRRVTRDLPRDRGARQLRQLVRLGVVGRV